MVFQFTSASDTSSNGQVSGSSTPTPPNGEVPAPTAGGAGLWIERMNHLQNRSNVPHPKRRKTEDAQDFAAKSANVPVRSSSGMLGEYVRERQKEANGQTLPLAAPTVDLTDGKKALSVLVAR